MFLPKQVAKIGESTPATLLCGKCENTVEQIIKNEFFLLENSRQNQQPGEVEKTCLKNKRSFDLEHGRRLCRMELRLVASQATSRLFVCDAARVVVRLH